MYFEIIINFGDNIFICLVLYTSKCTYESVLNLHAWTTCTFTHACHIAIKPLDQTCKINNAWKPRQLE